MDEWSPVGMPWKLLKDSMEFLDPTIDKDG